MNSTEALDYRCDEYGMDEGTHNVSIVEEEFFYFCTPCSKRYKRTKKLFNAVHSLDSCYTCIRCGQAFHSGFSRKKMNSTEAVDYGCDEYGMAEGNVSIYRCDECGITFRSSTQFRHHSYRHSDGRPERCSHCQKGFAKAFFLKRHLKERQCYCFNCMGAFRGNVPSLV
ncbi:hypothetical protein TNIN_52651 [Trichonephila inaurata madagascariensis]|uniref:C2H2-type domain-containing protein n=1 Tax=Trichonephila inaurata madagascariensis TaxID=2747483 RepID=A0A8X7CMY5_9ARAC|nr:hypothetical protein TNIN_52651 [Trichonephila inaurata madagascariensis]